jgi:probable HAF family extracellular repeat protein
MAAAPDGSISATVTVRGFETRKVVWHGFALRPKPALNDSAEVAQLRRLCEDFPKSSIGPIVAGTLTDGAIVATMQSPDFVDLDDTSGQYAPVVLHLRSNQCLNMGNGVAFGTGGMFTAGYTAYLNRVPAPSNVISARETFVAMRWRDRTREPLGDGVALAVNAYGDAAGASVPPGKGSAFNVLPHARIWIGNQPPVQPAESAAESVAYAIDAHSRVVGTMQDAAGRHYAFVWQDGTLRRLDDVVHLADWRFECAYAFDAGGGIVGVGTYRGAPTAFVVSGLI